MRAFVFVLRSANSSVPLANPFSIPCATAPLQLHPSWLRDITQSQSSSTDLVLAEITSIVARPPEAGPPCRGLAIIALITGNSSCAARTDKCASMLWTCSASIGNSRDTSHSGSGIWTFWALWQRYSNRRTFRGGRSGPVAFHGPLRGSNSKAQQNR